MVPTPLGRDSSNEAGTIRFYHLPLRVLLLKTGGEFKKKIMARTIAVIQGSMTAAVAADSVLGPLLTSSSKVSVWRLFTYVVASAIFVLETLFDSHKAEVAGIIAAQVPHRLQWYQTKALAFQYGAALAVDMDVYSPVAAAGDASLVVSFAAAVELSNLIRIKVATSTGGVLGSLSGPQLTAFTAYMAKVKDAGVRLQCTSGAADTFQPTMVIYYDPLVLDATGARLDGTEATPVLDAVNAFLSSLPFNGVFIVNNFIAAMQGVAGVVIADDVMVQAFYGATPPVVIAAQYVPDAGYMALDTVWFAANVSYMAYS